MTPTTWLDRFFWLSACTTLLALAAALLQDVASRYTVTIRPAVADCVSALPVGERAMSVNPFNGRE